MSSLPKTDQVPASTAAEATSSARCIGTGKHVVGLSSAPRPSALTRKPRRPPLGLEHVGWRLVLNDVITHLWSNDCKPWVTVQG